MNKRLQGFIAGILCCILFMGIPAIAKNTTETISAIYKDIKIYIDGIKIDPKDATGKTVEPFVYNGTTYLPVRAVGEAIGKQVTWDGMTSSVYLGDVPGGDNNWMEQCPPYQYSKAESILSTNGTYIVMGGKKYTDGIKFHRGWNSENISSAFFNLDGKYKSVSFTVGCVDDDAYKAGATINIYTDGKLIKTIEYAAEALPKNVTVQLKYANQMKIEVVSGYGVRYGIVNGHFE